MSSLPFIIVSLSKYGVTFLFKLEFLFIITGEPSVALTVASADTHSWSGGLVCPPWLLLWDNERGAINSRVEWPQGWGEGRGGTEEKEEMEEDRVMGGGSRWRRWVGGWVWGGVIVRLFWKTAHVKAALNYNTNHPSALCSPRAPRRHNITPTCVEFA